MSKISKILNKDFLINKFLPIFSVIFFICWRFFFNFLLWRKRLLPPVPGDSFNYLRHLKTVATGFVKLSGHYFFYSNFLGYLAKLFSLNVETIFRLTFWLGPILLALVLYYFFKKLNFSPLQLSLGFLFLTFYTGHGSFHGFFWVVPSFFVLLIFLYLSGALISSTKSNWWLVSFLAFIYPLFHRMAFFSLAIFFFYFLFYLFFSNLSNFSWQNLWQKANLQLGKKTLLIIFLGIISFSLVSLLLPWVNKSAPPEERFVEASETIPIIKSYLVSSGFFSTKTPLPLLNFSSEKIVKGYREFRAVYLDYILPHYLFLGIWLIIFFLLFFFRQYQLLALYFACFLFALISSLFAYLGFRSVFFLWPITYLLIITAFYYLFRFFQQFTPFKKLFLTLLISSFSFLYLFNIAYSFYYIDTMNKDVNISLNPSMFNNLLAFYSPQKTLLYFDDYLAKNYFLYRFFDQQYFLCPSKEVCEEKVQKEKDLHLIFILTDEKAVYQTSGKKEFLKNLLKKSLLFFKNGPLLVGNSPKVYPTIEEKLKNFPSLSFQKPLYRDEYFYIFELIYGGREN